MNKKIVTVFAVVALSLPAIAQGALQLPACWQDAIKQKVDYSTFNYSIKTLEKSLLLTIPVTKQFFDKDSDAAQIPFQETAQYRQLTNVETYPSIAGCKAYALDDHWVVAGGTCLWNGRHTVEFNDKSDIFATGLVEPNPAEENLQINGTAITWKDNLFIQPHEHQVPHIILVRVPANTGLSRRLQRWPKINILAFKHATPADLKDGKFYINSARYGLNVVRERSLEPNPVSTTVTLQDKRGELSGVSTDPLAYMKKGHLYWIGVNDGITHLRYGNLLGDWDGKTSNKYFCFTPDDAAFIKQTISSHDPAAWQRIEQRKGLEIL